MIPIKRGTARRLSLRLPSNVYYAPLSPAVRLDKALKLKMVGACCPSRIEGTALGPPYQLVAEQCALARSHDGAHESVSGYRWQKRAPVQLPSGSKLQLVEPEILPRRAEFRLTQSV